MAGRDPTRPQLEFPELVAELITQLRLSGQVGRLNFSDEVIPAFLIGSRGINFGGDLPVFNSAAVFQGDAILPGANFILVDTGPLPAGDYDMMLTMSLFGNTAGGTGTMQLQHRNAANAATLANMMAIPVSGTFREMDTTLPLMAYTLGLNERLRVASAGVAMTVGSLSATLFVRIRPTP